MKEEQGLYLSGAQVLVKECNILITQPTIRQIEIVGETDFLSAVQVIADPTIVTEPLAMGNSQLENAGDFQLLIGILQADQGEELRKHMSVFAELCFPQYNIKIKGSNFSFSLKDDEEQIVCGMINPMNFDKFSQVVKDLFISFTAKADDFNPANDKAKEIANKLKQGRKRVETEKGNAEGAGSLFGLYVSILSVGLPMDLNTLMNYTPFQVYDIFNRYFKKSEWDEYRRIVTMPFMDASNMEVDNWIENMY